MHPRNATLRRLFQSAFIAIFLPRSFVISFALIPILLLSSFSATHAAPLWRDVALAPQQGERAGMYAPLPFVFLIPTTPSSIALQAHNVKLTALDDGAGGIVVQIVTRYRFRNEEFAPAATTLRLSSALSGTFPADLAVSIAGQLAGVTQDENGGQYLPLQLAAESRLDVEVAYSIALPATSLLRVYYPMEALTTWQSTISMNVEIELGAGIELESVVERSPDDWTFPRESGQGIAVRWLLDGFPPQQPFSVQFIQPTLWRQIREARTVASAGGAAEWLRLGDLYANVSTSDTAQRDGFYAQALAAYTTGLERAPDSATSAELQSRLARLYRSRIVQSSGAASLDYARLTVQSVDAAFEQLADGDARRVELAQWRADALTVLLNEARRRNDWDSARQIVDRLSQMAGDVGNSRFVEEAKRRLIIQQALELLEAGNRKAALAIAGSEIGAQELQAPADLQSLFESWHVTVTVTPAATRMEWLGLPAETHEQAAGNALQELINGWKARSENQRFQIQLLSGTAQPGAPSPYQVQIEMPAGASAQSLAEATGLRNDWALFRTLFAQFAPTIEQQTPLFRQKLTLRQSIDLRLVAEQWSSVASNLEMRASAFETQANAPAESDAAAEASLRAKIQFANYRGAAHTWSNLARNSVVAVTLASSARTQDYARTWLVTPTSPAQVLEFEANTLNWGWVLATIAGGFFLIFLLAGTLWWLL